MRTNYAVNETVQFATLTQDAFEEIWFSALEVLGRTGVKVASGAGVALLDEAGSPVDADGHVRLPSAMVKRALDQAPECVLLAGRNRDERVLLRPKSIRFTNNCCSPDVVDPTSDEVRPLTLGDVYDSARLMDALPNVDLCGCLGPASDVTVGVRCARQLLALLRGTTKPLVLRAASVQDLDTEHALACELLGGEAEFRKAPLFALNLRASSPLILDESRVDKLLRAVDHGIPVIFDPGSVPGQTSPPSVAGALVHHLSGFLAALVLAQLRQPGSAIVMGGIRAVSDSAADATPHAAPEVDLLNAGLADAATWMRMPFMASVGLSDSQVLDEQAAMEMANAIAVAGMSGPSLIGGLGALGGGSLASYDALVLGDELVSMCKHIYGGVDTDDEHLAVSVIEDVGPGGNFLTEPHTLAHFRTQHWFPTLMDRQSRDDWESGGSKSLSRRVREKVRDLLERHQPTPLPAAVEAQLLRAIDHLESA